MKPQNLTTAEKAKSILLEHGWAQAPNIHPFRQTCLVLALDRATENDDVGKVDQILLEMGFQGEFDLRFEAMMWNDEPGRTVEEVFERLDRI
jgi:hypothetical protein